MGGALCSLEAQEGQKKSLGSENVSSSSLPKAENGVTSLSSPKGNQTLANRIIELQRQSKEGSLSQRQDALLEQARLYFLAGKLEESALLYEEGAALNGPGRDGALFEAARSYLLMGEAQKSRALLLKIPTTAGGLWNKAQLLLFLGATFESGVVEKASLEKLLGDPKLSEYVPFLYWWSWFITGEEAYQRILVQQYPSSLFRTLTDPPPPKGAPITLLPRALWLLGSPAAFVSQNTLGMPIELTPSQGEVPSRSYVQVGLFSREVNARELQNKLQSKGFPTATIILRTIQNVPYWSVVIPAGQEDVSAVVLKLKDAGYEAFPVQLP
ncbi:MAG: SPOR domain-containing protein [Treponemataceae bacterium]|nr:SPOR domain-containing protein [Treponemataceae bacterium]